MTKRNTLIAVAIAIAALIGTFLLISKSKADQKISFFIPVRDISMGPPPSDAARVKAENILSVQNRKVKIDVFEYPLLNHLSKNNINFKNVDAGFIDALQLIIINQKGLGLRPLYAVSPHIKYECNNELQIIVNKNSKIMSLQDLKGKNVAVVERAMRGFGLLVDDLNNGQIKFENIYLRKPLDWAVENLASKKVDAMIIPVSTLSNGLLFSKLGSFFQGGYEEMPDLKVLKTTKNVIPCGVLFVRETMDQLLQKEFISNIDKIFKDSNSITVMRDLALAGSISVLTEEHWQAIDKVLRKAKSPDTFQLLAKNVIKE